MLAQSAAAVVLLQPQLLVAVPVIHVSLLMATAHQAGSHAWYWSLQRNIQVHLTARFG